MVLLLALSTIPLMAQRNRISGAIDNTRRAMLGGHLNPSARPEFDRGPVDPARVLARLTVVLKPSASQQADLERLLAAQQDPSSADYHRWLTPEQYADRFGASMDDIHQIAAWLASQNLKVTGVARARNWISFSGTAAQVQAAFRTELHQYDVNGEMHFANVTDPSVPVALQAVVRSVRGLHDFRMRPLSRLHASATVSESPAYTAPTSGNHFLTPDDIATIYNIREMYGAGIDGSGQKLVIAGQTQIDLSDIQQFRSRFNLPASDPQIVQVPDTKDPGVSATDLPEADLDIEWSGAVAPNAAVIYVFSDDVLESVQYAIDQNLAPVISVSYGLCETETPNSDALTFQSWAQQGNAQGITWFTASGDSGGADCITSTSSSNGGPSVDIPASIPEVTGVGGTQFAEGTGQYWSDTNNVNSGSALGYIPEMVWNESSLGNPGAGGGGASVVFSQPSWQRGPGVPDNSARNVPDVSLSASAGHDGYMVSTRGAFRIYGGTSVSAPVFAGIATLLNHYLVSVGAQSSPGLGNMNPMLYGLAQIASGVFHDILDGDNIVTVNCGARSRNCTPGSFGFSAGPGYDQASGLGSVDAHHLALAWTSQNSSIARGTPAMTLSSSAAAIASTGSVTFTAAVASTDGGTPSGTVKFYLNGVLLDSPTLRGARGSSGATVIASGAELPLGTNTMTALYNGDFFYGGASASATVSVTSSVSGPPAVSALANGASFRKSYAPGMVLTVFGSALAPSTWQAGSLPLPSQLAGASAAVNGVTAPLYFVSPGQLNIQIPYEVPVDTTAELVVTNNGRTAKSTFAVTAAAPAIFTDAKGTLVPTGSASSDQLVTMFITGQGAVAPSIPTGAAPPASTSLNNLPAPVQSASVTVGAASAPIQFIGIPPGLVGVVQINFQVPAGLAAGPQSVVVRIGGVDSPPATLTVSK
ncbi:MAG: Ig-like domain repeat protein [Acidobacteriia bacterium]|nr:Ig-like domain repeat protein [Terriglobia bacterium]